MASGASGKCADYKGENAMPSDVAIVVAGIVLAFVIFAATLAWGDFQTRGHRSESGE